MRKKSLSQRILKNFNKISDDFQFITDKEFDNLSYEDKYKATNRVFESLTEQKNISDKRSPEYILDEYWDLVHKGEIVPPSEEVLNRVLRLR